MKVLMINGSPRPQGNTALALGELERTFADLGIESETVQVGQQAVRGCIACGRCGELGRCVFDDAVNVLARNMAFLMRSIALGKERYGLPETEPHAWTHFIR